MTDGYSVRVIGGEQLERRVRQFELLLSDLRPFLASRRSDRDVLVEAPIF